MESAGMAKPIPSPTWAAVGLPKAPSQGSSLKKRAQSRPCPLTFSDFDSQAVRCLPISRAKSLFGSERIVWCAGEIGGGASGLGQTV